jgi:hypothetical protein
MKKIIVILFILLTTLSAWAQQAVITASLDSAQIMIGEQTRLHLEIASNNNLPLHLPIVPDTLMQGVEVLNISKPDTTDLGNNRMQIQYDYLITSFDSALYMLPPFRLIAGNDTFYSNELALKVSTLPVDTASGKFYDIKNVMNPAFVLADYVEIFWWIFAACLLALLIIYIIFRKKKKKPLLPFKKEEKPALPPHVRAIQALDTIKGEKLWQQGKNKEYHSQISDVIREYIDERFQVNAMEMTSGQILQTLQGESDVDLVFSNLKQMLLLSDLAKFAKYDPLAEENELSMMNAYLFVNSTTPVIDNEENEKNKQ